MLDKAIRDLDRERMGLQNQEKKLVAEIKKTAKQGQMVLLSHQQNFLSGTLGLHVAQATSSLTCERDNEDIVDPQRLKALCAACRMR